MAENRLLKTCLMAVVLLLSIIAVNSIMRPETSHAATQYSYEVVDADYGAGRNMQLSIDKMATQGWELVTSQVFESGNTRCVLIFRRP